MHPALRQALTAESPRDAIVAHVAVTLGVPAALLDRDGDSWRFRAHARPAGAQVDVLPHAVPPEPAGGTIAADTLAPWTAISLGQHSPPSALLLLPGPAQRWQTPAVRQMLGDVGLAVDVVAQREEMAAARQDRDAVVRLSEALARLKDDEPPYEVALRILVDAVDAEIGALGVIPIGGTHLSLKATRGYPSVLVADLRVGPGDGILGEVLASGQPLVVKDASQRYKQCAHRRRYRSDSFVVVPLKIGDETIGTIALTDRRDGAPFDARSLETVNQLTPVITLAVARARLHEQVRELQHLATQDPLTGLRNRRHFRERLDAEVPRAHRQRTPLSLLVIDADEFKSVNDTWGHAAGDAVLKDVADVLRRTVRVFDVCARLGGDEFAVLMPGSDADAARATAERIKRQLSSLTFPVPASSGPLRLTVSIGVAVLQPDARADDLLLEADRALYEAKATGSGHVRLWAPPERVGRP